MDKLFDLMMMGFKYQLLCSTKLDQVLEVSPPSAPFPYRTPLHRPRLACKHPTSLMEHAWQMPKRAAAPVLLTDAAGPASQITLMHLATLKSMIESLPDQYAARAIRMGVPSPCKLHNPHASRQPHACLTHLPPSPEPRPSPPHRPAPHDDPTTLLNPFPSSSSQLVHPAHCSGGGPGQERVRRPGHGRATPAAPDAAGLLPGQARQGVALPAGEIGKVNTASTESDQHGIHMYSMVSWLMTRAA
jgi:hypothetical protein